VAPLVAVTYVPNAAPVRQKMLFAATRLTLTRELGSESFRETLFTTDGDELTPAGWKKHEAHQSLAQPLTEEERNLVDIKEAEATEIGGTTRRGAGYGDRKSNKAADGVLGAIESLKDNDLLLLKIDANETIVLADSSNPLIEGVAPGQLTGHFSTQEPRYGFYKHSFSSAEGAQSAVIFIYTCPSPTKVRDRMIYASSRRSAEMIAERDAGITISKKVRGIVTVRTTYANITQIEATDPGEITAESIEAEFTPKQETKAAFAKPKRPGRR
jgi:twinfilin-like protein